MEDHYKTKPITPTRVTAGTGIYYETDVVAACLVELLREDRLENRPATRLAKVSCQKQDDRWLLDDLLLSYAVEGGDSILVPTSIKSFQLFSKQDERDKFVAKAWSDFYAQRRRPRCFQAGQDHLGLFCSFGGSTRFRQLDVLVAEARSQGSDYLERIVEPGHLKDAEMWLRWLSCPNGTVGSTGNASDFQSFIASFHVRNFDFGAQSSRDQNSYRDMCRRLTVDEVPESGDVLWNEVWAVAKDLRSQGGDLSRSQLIERLSGNVQLKAAPRFSQCYRILQSKSGEALAIQPRKIVDRVYVPRESLLDSIVAELDTDDGRATSLLLTGESGTGKSTVAAELSERLSASRSTLFFALETVYRLVNDDLFAPFTLTEVLRNVSSRHGVLVVDGIEHATSLEQIQSLAKLLVTTREVGCWHIVLTCQDEHLRRVSDHLARHGLNFGSWKKTPVTGFSNAEIGIILAELPVLSRLLQQPKLPSLYRRPVIIDALARIAEQEIASHEIVGESHSARWIWENRVSQLGMGVTNLLLELGRRQADETELETHTTHLINFSTEVDVAIAASLLVLHQDKLRFAHDIYADWARLRWLLSSDTNLLDVLRDRGTNPRWYRAIRLLAIDMLEQQSTTESWEKQVDSQLTVSDLFLDGLLFSAKPKELLAKVEHRLFKDDAKLAKRLVRRAMIICTAPGLLARRHREAGQRLTAFVRTYKRDPKPYYASFGPMLLILANDIERTVNLIPYEACLAAHMWLEMTPTDWPYRAEAAQIVLAVAEDIVSHEDKWNYADDREAVEVFKASLYGIEVFPDRAKKLFFAAAGLDPTSHQARQQEERLASRAERLGDPLQVERRWPGGPIYESHECFRRACFDDDAMWPVFETDPDLAQELLYALSVKVRSNDDEVGVTNFAGIGPNENCLARIDYPMSVKHYRLGPFLAFLRTNLLTASRLIVDMANFASARSVALSERHGRSEVIMQIESPLGGGNQWLGDEHVFAWNRGYVSACDQMVPPLSALEKTLGDLVEQGTDVAPVLGDILARCRSVAIAGTLIDLGRRHPVLFSGVLKPLLSHPILLLWSETTGQKPKQPRFGGIATEYGEAFFEKQKAWLFADFRTLSTVEIARSNLTPDALTWNDTATQELSKLTGEEFSTALDRIRSLAEYRKVDSVIPNMPQSDSTSPNEESTNEENTVQEVSPLDRAIQDARWISRGLAENASFKHEYLGPLVDQLFAPGERGSDPVVDALLENNRLGCLLLLLLNHRDWLREQALEVTALAQVMTTSISRAPEIPESVLEAGGYPTFSSSIARLSVESLAMDVSSLKMRRWVVEVIFTGRARTYHAVAVAVWNEWAKLKEWGPRILRLILEASSAIWQIEPDSLSGRTVERDFDFDKWADAKADAFESGDYSSSIPSLDEVFLSSPRLLYDNWRHERDTEDGVYWKQPPVDEPVIEAVVAGTPLGVEAGDNSTRQVRLAIVQFLLDLQLRVIQPFDQNGNPLDLRYDGYPQMLGQRTVLERIVQETRGSSEPAHAEPLWQQILRLGTTVPHWVESFLIQWMGPIIGEPHADDRFAQTWRRMLAFVKTLDTWTNVPEDRPWHSPRQELLAKLLCVDKSYYSLWHSTHAATIQRLKSEIEPILREVTAHPPTAAPAMRWIASEVGGCFLPESITWLSAVGKSCEQRSPESNRVNALATYLDVAYHDHANELLERYREQFFDLISQAARSGNSMAVELQQRVAGL